MPNYPDPYLSLRAQLGIDLLALDDELMKMPQLVQDAAELAAEANDDANAAALAYEVCKAEAGLRIRESAPHSERVTEASIERQLPLDPEVQDARVAADQAKTYAGLVHALVQSLRTKSTLLQKASELVIAGYITPNAAYQRRREEMAAQRNR